jgi:hypothetical protein
VRLLDFFKVPTVVDIDGRYGDTPYRASCPKGDWQSDRWVATARTAREQQTRHWAREHYQYDDDSIQNGWGWGGMW